MTSIPNQAGSTEQGMVFPVSSILMPVYNAEATLEAALDSAIGQQGPSFEVIAIDDGSSDSSSSILWKLKDSRLRVFSQSNKGLAATLNRGLALASGHYIGRLDNDDLALPGRIERQVAYLDANPEVALVGTWAEIYVGSSPSGRFHRHPAESDRLRLELLFDNPFVHSSIMMRADVVKELGGYRVEGGGFPEDYELWSRIASRFEVANIPEVLTIYREVPGSITRTRAEEVKRNVVAISGENLARVLAPMATKQECLGLSALYHGIKEMPAPTLPRAMKLWRAASVAVGGAPSSWSIPFREGHNKAKRHLIAQYVRRILPSGMLDGLRAAKRHLNLV